MITICLLFKLLKLMFYVAVWFVLIPFKVVLFPFKLVFGASKGRNGQNVRIIEWF